MQVLEALDKKVSAFMGFYSSGKVFLQIEMFVLPRAVPCYHRAGARELNKYQNAEQILL